LADQLVVKQASEDLYLIVLKAKAVKWISGKLVDQWIDGGVKDREDAKQDIIKIFEELRQPTED